ncbi:PAS domain S-box protein (macronuclear) [Tetrahymena thermophila SB210]|uniref:PAS domain S-box protein n=1 Tax=Tetrahymena thermophila (strain SB210) TaxID=312017 RepID=Q22AA0_TETTS|nr:PAS domain S-box protein [Tetrahymena thermophila SB210]EAR82219.2 PAS domain S-box protein [Tetrahymena thermophila SB210]|eukprot:XP_001029882.2 PAS domain S-box protein [Tetrahymena thermophila SB210]
MANQESHPKGKVDILHEESSLESFFLKIKNISFQVLSVLLKNEEEEVLMVFIMTGVDYMQMHSFPFHAKLQHVWKATTFLQIIFQLFNVFHIKNYMPHINFVTYIIGIYFLDFIILLIILDILYVSYSFSQKKFSITWPLKILNQVTSYFVTVFFLPITENLFSVLECEKNAEGVQSLATFETIECWKGWMLVHQIVTSLFNLIFVIISSIVALTFFEPRMTSKNKTARQDSLAEVIFIITKVACQILFNFVPEGNDWFLVLLSFTFSACLYWSYNFEEPYYDKFVGKFFNIATTYYLWTNVMLLVSLVFYETEFNGGLIIWILGLPFICFIMLTSKKSRIDTLITSQTKFRSGEQIQGHLRYVLELIGTQKTDRNSYMLLIGYVEKHKEVCQEEDCPLKIKKTRKGKHADIEMDEIIKNLIKELGRLYQNGLRKFPTCTKLRLSYAFFLFERLKKKEEALVQFKLSMTTKPTFDEQFIIYRYMEQISSSQEEEDEDEEEENDVVKKIEFDSHMSQCEEYMKLAAAKHKEFWANLREDNNIALGRLNILGSGISQCVYKSKEHFNGMLKINNQLPQPYKVFGQYLIRVLNQREQGIELLQKGRELAKLQQKTQKIDDIEDLINDPRPYLVTYKKFQSNTQIQAINLLFSVLFGFQKEEIQGKELKVILPNQFTDIHETLIQQMNDNMIQGNYISNYIDNPQQRFGRHRSGYIFPITYNVKPLSDDYTKFYVNIEADMQTRSQIIILTNEDFIVTDISSSAITYFDINLAMIKNDIKFGIENIISDFETEKEVYLKKGKEFNFNNQAFMVSCQTQLVPIENKDAIDEEQYLTYEILGYIFKIDKLERGMIINQQQIQQQFQQPSLNAPSNTSFQNLSMPSNLNPKETFKDYIKDIQKENLNSYRDAQFTYRDAITQNTYRDTVTENTYRDTYREETTKLKDQSQINYSPNLPLSSPVQNIPIISSANNLSMTNLSMQNLFSLEAQSSKNAPQSTTNNNGHVFNLNIQNLQFNKKITNDNSPLPLSSNRGSARNVLIKQKNYNSQSSFPMIVLEQNNLAENDLSSSSNQEVVNNCQQKQNKFSKFLFDFYKTPAEDETFFYDEDDSTNQYSMVKKETKNYSKDIKTKRLFNNQIINIYDGDDNENQEEEDEDNEDSVFKNENNYYQSQEEYEVFNQNNTSQIIQKSLNYDHKHQLISIFKWVSFMWLMCILIISIFQCALTIIKLNQYSEDMDIMFEFSQRNFKAVSIVSQAIDLVYIKQDLYFPNYIFMDEIRQNMSSTIVSISNITTSIGDSYLDYFADNQSSSQMKIFSSSLQNNFRIQIVDNDQLINSLVSLGALIISQDDSQISLDNGYFNSIIYNYYHTIGEFIEQQNQQIYDAVNNRLNSPQYELIAAFFVLGTIGILNMILFIYFMISLKDQRENILFLFLDIPIKHINFLYKNCDSFLKKYVSIQELINRNENQGQDSSDDEDQDRDMNTRKLYKDDQQTTNEDEKELEKEIMKKRIKIIKNYKKHKFRGQQFMILKCFIVLAFSFIYSIIDLAEVIKLQSQISSLIDQYSYDLNISYKFQNYFNVLKITLINPNYPIENITAQNYVVNQYNKLLGRNGKLQQFNFDILNNYDDIENAYYKVFYMNGCSLLDQEIQSECQMYINNSLQIGLDNAIQFYASYFQQTLNELLVNNAQSSTLSKDKFFVETNISLQKFVDPLIQYFTSAENDSLTASIQTTNNLETLLVILFNIFLILIFLIFWLPKISDMNVEINRTIQMLNMIPLKVMKENRNIRAFIKYLIDQTHKQSDT